MKKAFYLGLMTALAFTLSTSAMAESGGFFGKKKSKKSYQWGTKELISHKAFYKAHFYLDNAEEIGLTPEQQEKIRTLSADLKKEVLRNKAEIEATQIDLREELRKKKLDSIKIPSLIDKEYELKKTAGKAAIKALIDIKGTLKPEQKEKAGEIWKNTDKKKSRYSKDKGKCPYYCPLM